jgi:hypothetical protein
MRYNPGVAHERMEQGLCPECGEPASHHNPDPRFWIPRNCDLLPAGVDGAIAQFRADRSVA